MDDLGDDELEGEVGLVEFGEAGDEGVQGVFLGE